MRVHRNTRSAQIVQNLHGIMRAVFGRKDQIGCPVACDKNDRPSVRDASRCTERVVMTVISGAQMAVRAGQFTSGHANIQK